MGITWGALQDSALVDSQVLCNTSESDFLWVGLGLGLISSEVLQMPPRDSAAGMSENQHLDITGVSHFSIE